MSSMSAEFSSFSVIIWFLLVVWYNPCTQAEGKWPLYNRITGHHNDFQFAMEYLQKYGYLRRINPHEMRRYDEFDKALKAFQNFSKLPTSGSLDAKTISKMKLRRCGVKDFSKFDIFPNSRKTARKLYGRRQKRYAIMGKWPNNVITYRFDTYTKDMSVKEQRDAVSRAFRIWSESTPLVFQEVSGTQEDITISFLKGEHDDGYPFDGPGQTLAHAFFPGQGSRSGDAHFDEDENWTNEIDESKGTNLYMVASHEFGHALGLGHSSFPDSVMLPFYQGYVEGFSLGSDDKNAIQHLYGKTEGIASLRESIRFVPPPTSSPGEGSIGSDGLAEDGSLLSKGKVRPICNQEFDAVVNIRNTILFIKGNDFWRLDHGGGLVSEEKVPMKSFWTEFPDVDVDAAFTRPSDQNTVFISGDQYWVYINNMKMDPSSPRPISDFGLSGPIDAALLWSANSKIYFYKGNQYWKYEDNAISPGYPKHISSVMKGVPDNIDAALNHPDGHAYFLKGKQAWKFDDNQLSISPGYPKYIDEEWFGCNHSDYPEYYTSTASITNSAGETVTSSEGGNAVNSRYNMKDFKMLFTFVTLNLALCGF